METYTDFAKAMDAKPEGWTLGVAMKGPQPVYFAVDPEWSDGKCRDVAFEIVRGRPRSEFERKLEELGAKVHAART